MNQPKLEKINSNISTKTSNNLKSMKNKKIDTKVKHDPMMMEWIDDEISYYSECNSPYELYTKEMIEDRNHPAWEQEWVDHCIGLSKFGF